MRRWRCLLVLLQVLVLETEATGGGGTTSLNNSTKSNECRQGNRPDDADFFELVLEKNLEVVAPTAATIENDLCRRQAVHYAKAVREGVEWAVQMFDAGSKTPLNLMSDQGFHLGSYDACVTLENIPTAAGPISGQHCVVAVGVPTWGTRFSIYQRMRFHVHELEGKLRAARRKEGGSSSRGKPGFTWSLCVPASCGPGDVRRHLVSVLPTLAAGNNTRGLVGSVECSSRADERPFAPADWLLGGIIVVLLGLVTVGTWRDLLPTRQDRTPDALGAFSLRRGVRQLFGETPRRSHVDEDAIPALDGLRVLSMMTLFLYHHQTIREHLPHSPSPSSALDFEDDVWRLRSRFAVRLHVDTFVLLGALLVCFNHLRAQQRGANFKLLGFYFQRVVRTGPLLWLTALLMTSNLQYYLGEGPLFKLNVQEHQRNCAENLSQVLFFLGNFLPTESMCALHAWYVAVDMQLVFLAPLFIKFLHSIPLLGKGLVGSFLQISLILGYAVTSYTEMFYLGVPYGQNVEIIWFHTYMRLTPWFTGIGVGYVLHVTARAPVPLSRLQVTAAWILTAAMMTAAQWMGPVVLGWEDHQATLMFINAQSPMWSLGLAWVIFACSRGHGGRVASVLSWRGFLVASRLSYAFYITHVIVIGIFALTVKTVDPISAHGNVTYLLRDLGCSFLVATVVHLVVELPAINLGKVLGSSEPKPTKPKVN